MVAGKLANIKKGGDRKSENQTANLQDDISQAVAGKLANMNVGKPSNSNSANLQNNISQSEAGKLANMNVGKPSNSNSANLPNISQTDAAELLNVSDRSVRTAKKVQEKAVPELSEKFYLPTHRVCKLNLTRSRTASQTSAFPASPTTGFLRICATISASG
jgi:hypothetical protein